jgi:hypothetical protein
LNKRKGQPQSAFGDDAGLGPDPDINNGAKIVYLRPGGFFIPFLYGDLGEFSGKHVSA